MRQGRHSNMKVTNQMNLDDLHATLIKATYSAADAALAPNSVPMRQNIADLLAQAQAALDALEEAAPTGNNVVQMS